jgi:hypothetical protein
MRVRKPPVTVLMNARRSMNTITDFDAVPLARAILRPLRAGLVRTSAEASGAAVSSNVAILSHGGLPGGAE